MAYMKIFYCDFWVDIEIETIAFDIEMVQKTVSSSDPK